MSSRFIPTIYFVGRGKKSLRNLRKINPTIKKGEGKKLSDKPVYY